MGIIGIMKVMRMVLISDIILNLLIIYLIHIYTNMDLVEIIMDNKFRRKRRIEMMERKKNMRIANRRDVIKRDKFIFLIYLQQNRKNGKYEGYGGDGGDR